MIRADDLPCEDSVDYLLPPSAPLAGSCTKAKAIWTPAACQFFSRPVAQIHTSTENPLAYSHDLDLGG